MKNKNQKKGIVGGWFKIKDKAIHSLIPFWRKRKWLVVLVVSVLSIGIVMLVLILGSSNNNLPKEDEKIGSGKVRYEEPYEKPRGEVAKNNTTTKSDGLYFLIKNDGKYKKIGVNTGKAYSVFPDFRDPDNNFKKYPGSGFILLSEYNYEPLSTYTILKQGDEIFAYNSIQGRYSKIDLSLETKSKIITPDSIEDADDLKIAISSWQKLEVYSSISESDKFLFNLKTLDGDNNLLSSETYFYNASLNKLTKSKVEMENSDKTCQRYDSLKERYFSWTCKGDSWPTTPLVSVSLDTGQEKVLISKKEFTEDENQKSIYIAMSYNNGKFLAIPKSFDEDITIKKIIVVFDTKEDKLDALKVNKEFISIFGLHPFRKIFMAGDGVVLLSSLYNLELVTFDDNKNMISKSTISEDAGKIKQSSIVVYNGIIYYQDGRNLKSRKISDLNNLRTKIGINGNFEAFNIFQAWSGYTYVPREFGFQYPANWEVDQKDNTITLKNEETSSSMVISLKNVGRESFLDNTKLKAQCTNLKNVELGGYKAEACEVFEPAHKLYIRILDYNEANLDQFNEIEISPTSEEEFWMMKNILSTLCINDQYWVCHNRSVKPVDL